MPEMICFVTIKSVEALVNYHPPSKDIMQLPDDNLIWRGY